jgi:glycosyltransferase involved in cell wall biosynthesis
MDRGPEGQAARSRVRIVQVGAYPPPWGGVTVHLMRLHEHLRREGLASTIVDLSAEPKEVPGVVPLSWSAARGWLAREPRSIVHFHNFEPGLARDYARLARRHVGVLSLHNARFGDDLAALGPLRRRLALARLRRLHCVVADSAQSGRLAARLWRGRSLLRVIPEFLPPRHVPPLDHPGVLDLRRRCRFLVASSAWSITFHRGEDLYGLDLAVELVARLVRERGLDVALVFLLPRVGDADYLEAMRGRASAAGVGDRCLFLTEPLEESSSLWACSDVVVRATNTDGNSLTVLEALACGVPVVASDCVERPEGTLTFRTRDAADLAERVAQVLATLDEQRSRVRRLAVAGNGPAFVELYRELGRRWIADEA